MPYGGSHTVILVPRSNIDLSCLLKTEQEISVGQPAWKSPTLSFGKVKVLDHPRSNYICPSCIDTAVSPSPFGTVGKNLLKPEEI